MSLETGPEILQKTWHATDNADYGLLSAECFIAIIGQFVRKDKHYNNGSLSISGMDYFNQALKFIQDGQLDQARI